MQTLLPFCITPLLNFASHFPTPEFFLAFLQRTILWPSASVGERKLSAMPVEDFVGAGRSVNWLSSNHLVLSSKCQIHFSWCLWLSAPSEVLQRQWACFSELSSSVGPTFHFYAAQSVIIRQLAFCLNKCVAISYQLLCAPLSFFLADLSPFSFKIHLPIQENSRREKT